MARQIYRDALGRFAKAPTRADSDRLSRELIDALREGLLESAQHVKDLAVANTPVGTAEDEARSRERYGKTLNESAVIHDDQQFGVIVEFEGLPYAVKQHEDLGLRHPRGGGPKYLENALKAVAPTMEAVVAARVRARLGP